MLGNSNIDSLKLAINKITVLQIQEEINWKEKSLYMPNDDDDE